MTPGYGYEVDIHRALWERPQALGAPKLWTIGWMVVCLYVGLLLLVVVSPLWAVVTVLAWFVGQFVLVSLTVWDSDWDLVLQSHLTQRMQDFYDAG